MRVNYAIVYVSDMARAVAFYRDVLGLPLKFESPGWTEFATEGATLALHAEVAGKQDSSQASPGSCRWGFSVPDLAEFHRTMLARQVPCLQEPTLVFGTPVAQYWDPDGMVFSVGEARKS
jgi:lactoylglutathione lyase